MAYTFLEKFLLDIGKFFLFRLHSEVYFTLQHEKLSGGTKWDLFTRSPIKYQLVSRQYEFKFTGSAVEREFSPETAERNFVSRRIVACLLCPKFTPPWIFSFFLTFTLQSRALLRLFFSFPLSGGRLESERLAPTYPDADSGRSKNSRFLLLMFVNRKSFDSFWMAERLRFFSIFLKISLRITKLLRSFLYCFLTAKLTCFFQLFIH